MSQGSRSKAIPLGPVARCATRKRFSLIATVVRYSFGPSQDGWPIGQ